MKRLVRFTLSIAAALLLAPLPAVPASAQQEPVKVGVIFPLSGGAGPNGQDVVKAIKLKADLINRKGGVLGRQIRIIEKDDESTPAVGVARANELIAEKVAVIIEGWNSPVTLAMQPVIARAGILDITAISKADQILSGKGNPLAIRLNSSNAQDGEVIARYLARDLRAKTIAFATENDAYGNGAQAMIEKELEALGADAKVVAVEKFPFTETDFRVALTSIKQAKADAVVAINASESSGMPALIRQYRQAGIEGQLVAAVGTVAPSVIEVAGPAADGLVSADIYFPDVEPFASIPANREFVTAHRERYQGELPDKYGAMGALALEVWAKAVEKTGTFDREAVAKAIRGGTFTDTILGDVRFLPTGQLLSKHYLFEVKDGTIVVRK